MNRFSIDKAGWIKVWKGALIAVGGALLTYVAQTAGGMDFGVYTPIVASALAILINAARVWLTDYTK